MKRSSCHSSLLCLAEGKLECCLRENWGRHYWRVKLNESQCFGIDKTGLKGEKSEINWKEELFKIRKETWFCCLYTHNYTTLIRLGIEVTPQQHVIDACTEHQNILEPERRIIENNENKVSCLRYRIDAVCSLSFLTRQIGGPCCRSLYTCLSRCLLKGS